MGGFNIPFVGPYRGFAVGGLYEYLERCKMKFMKQAPRCHSKHFAIIQSSVTGKTCTVFKVSAIAFTGNYD